MPVEIISGAYALCTCELCGLREVRVSQVDSGGLTVREQLLDEGWLISRGNDFGDQIELYCGDCRCIELEEECERRDSAEGARRPWKTTHV